MLLYGVATYFSDQFQVEPETLEAYGALNISLIADLPLFIDPFLLFNSDDAEYQALHEQIIQYLKFLRDKAAKGVIDPALLASWYCFPEVKQTWLGFSKVGNVGSGLGMDFARALHHSLHVLFPAFGEESITRGAHLEKVCLVRGGVGRDNISDFTTNLIKDYLCTYTQTFTKAYLSIKQWRVRPVNNAVFNYETERWLPRSYELPWTGSDYVLLCPKDMLTKDDTWINRTDLAEEFEKIPTAIPDAQLRAQINNYFEKVLVRPKDRAPSKAERRSAAMETVLQFPELIDWFIRYKEEHGDEAVDISKLRLQIVEDFLVRGAKELIRKLGDDGFYKERGTSYEETHRRLEFLKSRIETDGYRSFYISGKPVEREADLQRLFRYVWLDTSYAVSPEVNHGRGPADFEISKGSTDKTIVEMKLATNTQLKRNLQNQVELYQRASGAQHVIKVIVYFTYAELKKVEKILLELKIVGHRDVILIDARDDNKPSASKA